MLSATQSSGSLNSLSWNFESRSLLDNKCVWVQLCFTTQAEFSYSMSSMSGISYSATLKNLTMTHHCQWKFFSTAHANATFFYFFFPLRKYGFVAFRHNLRTDCLYANYVTKYWFSYYLDSNPLTYCIYQTITLSLALESLKIHICTSSFVGECHSLYK